MNIQINCVKIMLQLGSLMLVVTLVSQGLTAANAYETTTKVASKEIIPASKTAPIETDFKVLRLTTTASTIQLRLHDADDEFGSEEKLLATTKQLPNTEEVTATTNTYIPNTLYPSNVVAKESVLRQQAAAAKERPGKSIEDQMTLAMATTTQYKNNDELEREIKATDLKQLTESVAEQKQQPLQQLQPEQITTEVSWQKETDMHKQSTENDRNLHKYIKITATIATQTHTAISPSTTATLPHDTTTSTSPTHTYKEEVNAAVATTPPAEQNKPDSVKRTEIAGDDIKPAIDEIEFTALTLEQLKQGIDNFEPIIKDDNKKLLKERTIFSSKSDTNHEEWKQNLMPNELEYELNKPLLSKSYEHNINWTPYLQPAAPVTDFTGKLLQEQDGVITEIEQKFGLNKFDNVNEAKTTNSPEPTTYKTSLQHTQTTTFSKDSHSVNHKILDLNKNPILHRSPIEFIERRVKKSFDFPMHRVASDVQHLQQHFDFANTKFSNNNNEQHNMLDPKTNNGGQQENKTQPEFSTTKFYNSKELYNEMLLHKTKLQQQTPHPATNVHDKDIEELNNRAPSLTLNSFAVLHSPKIAKLEELHETNEPQQQHQKSLSIKKVTVKATKHKDEIFKAGESSTISTTSSTSATHNETPVNLKATPTPGLSSSTLTEMPLAALVKTKKFQKELKRAKLLIKSMIPLQNTTVAATTISTSNNKDVRQTIATTSLPPEFASQLETKINSHTAASLGTTTQHQAATTASPSGPTSLIYSQLPSSTSTSATGAAALLETLSASSTNSPQTSLHPIVRPRILSRLQEKINSLECELQNLPQDSHLWRGNETHELLLPIMICRPNWSPTSWFANKKWVLSNSRNCSASSRTPENCKNDKECTAMMVSWEGEAEIQSGDILIVEINDALLTPKDINLTTSAHNTQVYQVTRSGHEHCDVTEGILLDITPLLVDGRKLVTLYDKDLTEGVNLLIVVSELWGAQCVRLKVTTKTENCGESADCSGKGICFSNYDMEEYECQCCSGFAGPHCEEIDACTPSPCTNNGICVDLSQGHEGNAYQCLCPYGYTGKNCQYELDPCNAAECMNGGSCIGNSTHFRCECTPGYTGPLCQHSLNECESSPCIHGICVDQEDGFRCFCQPGFAGELCNFEYNECESNPCQNGGECIDHIGSYECHCSKGYTGNRCHIKVDFCSNKPCPEGRRCIDHGNEYSCECLGGRNGPDCNEMQRTQCNVNPCTHGGTCWSSGDSFYCACRPGYTGTMCEDEFVVETVVSSSEFMVDDTSARNFNDKSFGSSVVLKSPIELHNAYTAAIVLALVIFFVALYLTICHCKVNQTYRKFSTRTYGFLPILGFRLRPKQATSKISKHWLSGKGLGIGNAMRGGGGGGAMTSSSSTSALNATTATTSQRNSVGHLPTAKASSGKQQHTHVGQLNERPFQRHLAMNLENDMYYTVDFSENSQHSPLIQ